LEEATTKAEGAAKQAEEASFNAVKDKDRAVDAEGTARKALAKSEQTSAQLRESQKKLETALTQSMSDRQEIDSLLKQAQSDKDTLQITNKKLEELNVALGNEKIQRERISKERAAERARLGAIDAQQAYGREDFIGVIRNSIDALRFGLEAGGISAETATAAYTAAVSEAYREVHFTRAPVAQVAVLDPGFVVLLRSGALLRGTTDCTPSTTRSRPATSGEGLLPLVVPPQVADYALLATAVNIDPRGRLLFGYSDGKARSVGISFDVSSVSIGNITQEWRPHRTRIRFIQPVPAQDGVLTIDSEPSWSISSRMGTSFPLFGTVSHLFSRPKTGIDFKLGGDRAEIKSLAMAPSGESFAVVLARGGANSVVLCGMSRQCSVIAAGELVTFHPSNTLLTLVESAGTIAHFAEQSPGEWKRSAAIHPGYPATTLAWSPDGNRLAVGTSKGELKITDRSLSAWQRRYNAHYDKVELIRWANRDTILTAENRNWLSVWNVALSPTAVEAERLATELHSHVAASKEKVATSPEVLSRMKALIPPLETMLKTRTEREARCQSPGSQRPAPPTNLRVTVQ
jgi:hypothetical protein